jgi:hypothetical protein
VHHGGGYGLVQQHHRVVGPALEQAVQREDLRPVGVLDTRRLIVNRRNGGLELVRAGRAAAESIGNERDPFLDDARVPQGPVLLVRRDQLAARAGPCGTPGVGEQHERE